MPSGSRPGERRGGRQKGTQNKKTLAHLARAEKVAESGVTPVEIITHAMRYRYKQAVAPVDQDGNGDIDMEAMRESVTFAAIVAPYIHPRLQAIAPAPVQPPPEESGGSNLERARRVAYLLITGAREKAKKTALLK